MSSSTQSVPLCVDLDGTLVRVNTLAETIVGVLRETPALIFLIPFWAIRGQAYLWSKLVARFRPAADLLPYLQPVLTLVKEEAAQGRAVFLVTGAHEQVAQDVAAHVGLFSGVLATNGGKHLVGRQKADALVANFGDKGFDYAGDSPSDLEVFRKCRQAYIVSPSSRLADLVQAESIPAVRIHVDSSKWSALLSAMRPRQWVKNILVFVPALLGHRLTDAAIAMSSASVFVLLCLASSSVYLFNDIVDMEADRRHAIKRNRPFAKGAVPAQLGGLAALVLAALAVGAGWLVAPLVALLLAFYIVTTALYSVWLKRLLIIDMLLLASFYAARVYIGSAATGIRVSSWTALFCLFIFFGLAAVKRYAEVHNRATTLSGFDNRRAYTLEDAVPLISIGMSSFVGAVLSVGLYLGSADVHGLYQRPDLLWLICPILLGWAGRMWILGHRGALRDEDPVAFALHDRWSYWTVALCAIIFLLAL